MIPALVALIACAPTPTDDTGTGTAEAPVTIAALWAQEVDWGTFVRVDAVAISGRTRAGDAFYAQEAAGGARSGLRIDLGNTLAGVPPPIGTPIRVGGAVSWDGGAPIVRLTNAVNLEVLGDAEPPIATPWSAEPELAHALVSAIGVRVTSDVDPTGRADTDAGFALTDALGGDVPGWDATGDALGVAAPWSEVMLRPGDWTETGPASAPVAATIATVRSGDLADGTPIVLAGVVQGTPWGPTGDAVLQDPSTGEGVWVTTEGFGTPGTIPGDRLSLEAEVRVVDGLPRLRAWRTPTIDAPGQPVIVGAATPDVAEDGAIVDATASGLGAPDPWGERATAEGWILDDRLAPVDGLADPVDLRGAVRVQPDGVHLAPLP